MEARIGFARQRLQMAAASDHRVKDIQFAEGLDRDGFWSAQLQVVGGRALVYNARHFVQQVTDIRLLQKTNAHTLTALAPGLLPLRLGLVDEEENPLPLQSGDGEPLAAGKQQWAVDDLLLRLAALTQSQPEGACLASASELLQGWPREFRRRLRPDAEPPRQTRTSLSFWISGTQKRLSGQRQQCLEALAEAHALVQQAAGCVDRREPVWRELRWSFQGGSVPPLTTPRLLLRELDWHDFEAIHSWSVDPEVVKFMDWGPNTREQTKAHLQQAVGEQHAAQPARYELAICRKQDPGSCLGTVALVLTNALHGEASLGYTLSRSHWGQGVMTEAVSALLDWGWSTLGLHRIWATCSVENTASSVVLQRVGMEQEGRLRDHRFLRGRWHDSLLFGMTSPLEG